MLHSMTRCIIGQYDRSIPGIVAWNITEFPKITKLFSKDSTTDHYLADSVSRREFHGVFLAFNAAVKHIRCIICSSSVFSLPSSR